MRIIAASGEFDLPTNFETQLTKYNVMLSKSGEQSNPITLPPTPNNLRLVGYSNRIDALYKPIIEIAVTINNGLMVRPANLSIHTADDEDGISCTLYLGTADFYSRIDEVKLNALAWPVIKSPTYDSQTEDQRVDYLIGFLKAEYNNPTTQAIFKIAPVATSQEYTFRHNGVNATSKFILNGFDKRNQTLQLATTNDYLDVWAGEYVQTLIESNTAITLSKGYGITPFLKIHYVLSFIFGEYGYTLDMSEFEAITAQFPHWCLANNVADAIYAGVLKTKQLVPDVTVKAFINKIESKLAGKFVINEVNNKVVFKLYRNVLTAQPTIDISKYLQSKPKQQQSDFSELLLIDANDKSEKPGESEKTTVDISFEIMPYGYISEIFKTNLTPSDLQVNFSLLNVGEITHLSSMVVTPETTKESETESSTKKIQLLYIADEWESISGSRPNYSFWNLYYKKTDRLFYFELGEISESTFGIINWLYDEYKTFLKNSNVPVTAKLTIPTTVLNALDISAPVLLESQKMLIESIKEPIGNQGKTVDVEVILRTLRPYIDR